MTDSPAHGGPGSAAAPGPGGRGVGRPPTDWRRRVILGLVAVIAAAAFVLFATTELPRWWAHRVADRVDGSFTAGVLTGLLTGAVFTLLALVVAALAVRRSLSWKRRGLVAVGALALAGPNLTTLGIVLGHGSGARAARIVLDTRGDGFRGASLLGAVIGVAAFVGLMYLLASRRSRRREIDRLRGELGRHGAAGPTTG